MDLLPASFIIFLLSWFVSLDLDEGHNSVFPVMLYYFHYSYAAVKLQKRDAHIKANNSEDIQ